MIPQKNSPRINVIVLDINRQHPDFGPQYDALTAEEKIKRLISYMDFIASGFEKEDAGKDDDDKAMNIFIWREYGISDPFSKFTSYETKTLLLKEIDDFIERHPSANVFGGTIAFKKKFNNYNCAKDVFKKLDIDHSVINSPNLSAPHLIHLIDVKKLQTDLPPPAQGIDIVSNTCLVWNQIEDYGTAHLRHDKTTAWEETHDGNNKLEYTVFRNSKMKTASPVFNLLHTYTEEPLKIGVEICLEHACSVLQKSQENCDMHFVFSDWTSYQVDNICAPMFIKTDSKYSTAYIASPTESRFVITTYQTSVVKPLNPQQFTGSILHPVSFDEIKKETEWNRCISREFSDHLKLFTDRSNHEFKFLLHASQIFYRHYGEATIENMKEFIRKLEFQYQNKFPKTPTATKQNGLFQAATPIQPESYIESFFKAIHEKLIDKPIANQPRK